MGMFLNHKPKLATPEDVKNVFKLRKKVVVRVDEKEEPKTLNEMLKNSKNKTVCETPTSPDSGQVTGDGEDSNVENIETVNDEELPDHGVEK